MVSRQGLVPDFLLIGAPKSGTTALSAALDSHPDICMSKPKETRFFGGQAFADGPTEYRRRFFRHCRNAVALADGDPDNLFICHAPNRIWSMNADARIVAVLRDPSDRAWSHWWMDYTSGIEQLGFSEAIQLNLNQVADIGIPNAGIQSVAEYETYRAARRARALQRRYYVDFSLYRYPLDRYRRQFGDDRVLTVSYEELARHPEQVLRAILRFLQLPVMQLTLPRRNVAPTSVRSERFFSKFLGVGRATGISRHVPSRIKSDVIPHLWRTWFVTGRSRRPEGDKFGETEEMLADVFADDWQASRPRLHGKDCP